MSAKSETLAIKSDAARIAALRMELAEEMNGLGPIRCPMCHGEDEFCTLCDGLMLVTTCQHNEFRAQNPGAL